MVFKSIVSTAEMDYNSIYHQVNSQWLLCGILCKQLELRQKLHMLIKMINETEPSGVKFLTCEAPHTSDSAFVATTIGV